MPRSQETVSAWFLEAQAALESNPPARGFDVEKLEDASVEVLQRLAKKQSHRLQSQAQVLAAKDGIIEQQAELLRGA